MSHRFKSLALAAAALPLAALALTGEAPIQAAVEAPRTLPPAPASGVLGFVVESFNQPVIFEKEACPEGPVLRLRDAYLQTLPTVEATRLRLDANKQEWDQKWQAYAFNASGANVCTNPDMFDHPVQRTVKSRNGNGLDLDGGKGDDTCGHEEFVSPAGERGIDNQEYRAMGCTLEWRGVDGKSNDQETGMRQFHNSGEWTQVILLKGVDSLANDPDVQVVYANTPDRPVMDTKGAWLRGASFAVSDEAPRERNVLRGRIVGGVLTTDPADIKLAGTWGQSAQRDLRGIRARFDYRKARLRLTFQRDGSLTGMLGGYRPIFDTIISGSLGGAGTALVAGHDCASMLKTLRVMADGLKDPRTGKCEGISSAQQIKAIPAFVTDVPATTRITARSNR